MTVCFRKKGADEYGKKFQMYVESQMLYLNIEDNCWRIDPIANDKDHVMCKRVRGDSRDILWSRVSDAEIINSVSQLLKILSEKI